MNEEVNEKVNEEVNERVNEKVNEEVNEKVIRTQNRQRELLVYLAHNPESTISQLSEKMNISRKTVALYLKRMKDAGVLERIGSARNGYWKINKI